MKIYNAFGITPTNSFVSAGSDYYIPNIKTEEKANLAYKAFEKSYNKSEEEINTLIEYFSLVIKDKNNYIPEYQIVNMIHLFLALYNPVLEESKNSSLFQAVYNFVNNIMVFDRGNDKVGIRVGLNDTLFINSGIKVALDTVLNDQVTSNPLDVVNMLRSIGIGIAGLYVNKSGMGNRGFDVRACLVDEDYSGYVHLSMAYTKEYYKDNIVYCGDKLTQMMLIPVFHTQYDEIQEEEYNEIMSNSLRGDQGFGSQDIKH